ncbi:MAG: DUF881 domain-containing protein [Syntrophomonadaceae bacterium]|jgi:uncharacterized protein YlxW (UPF0749 family)|nr:DUF881 domain-containing protein [Syntrophomonadaceae bacterium]
MVQSRGAQISIAVVCMILGIMLAVQYNTTVFHKASMIPTTQSIENIAAMLDSSTKENEALNEKVASLTLQLDNVRQVDQALADLQKELVNTQKIAGLSELEGPGLVITVNDRPNNLQNNNNPNEDLIHEADLLMLINELKASGAEAITLNNERITAMTEVRCAGPVIIVNQNRIGTPFVISAMGNPDLLESGMNLGGGIFRQLKFQGFEISMEKSELIQMPANNQQPKFVFGKSK